MGLFRKKKMTLDKADEKNRAYISKNPESKDEEDSLMRQASSFLTSGNFEKSIELYQELANSYPNKKGLYLSQVGAGYYFLKDYNKAIEYYMTAKNEGADSDMIDDNVWEAFEAIYKNNKDKTAIEKYLEYFPNGNYLKKAKKILAK